MNVFKMTLAVMLLAVGLVPASAQSFQGITCDDVRSLSSAERDYWSDRLNLSAAQRRRIHETCLRGKPQGLDLSEKAVNINSR